MITDRLLSDAMDSTLTNIETIEKAGQIVVLRLRLHAMMQILFGRKIIVSEGWALDSMSFLKVGSEIAAAIITAKEGFSLIPDDYSPMMMEARREGDYIDILQAYLKRGDVRWSGFLPSLDREREKWVSKTIAESSSPDLRRIFGKALDHPVVPTYIAEVAQYFSVLGRKRIERARLGTRDFNNNFHSVFEKLPPRATSPNSDCDAVETLRSCYEDNFRDKEFLNSSIAMQRINDVSEGELHEALMRIVKFSYIRVAAKAGSAGLTTPAVAGDSSPLTWLTDSLMREEQDQLSLLPRLEFACVPDPAAPLTQKLVSEKVAWPEVWKEVHRLAHEEHWRKAVHAVRILSGEVSSIDELLSSREFRELKKIMADKIPHVVLVRSGLERIGLSLKGKLHDFAGYTAVSVAAGAAVHAVHLAFSPQDALQFSAIIPSWLAGAIAAPANRFLPDILDIDPASRNPSALFSSLVTPLDAVTGISLRARV